MCDYRYYIINVDIRNEKYNRPYLVACIYLLKITLNKYQSIKN